MEATVPDEEPANVEDISSETSDGNVKLSRYILGK
jgi:hypothetical protein